MKSPRPRVLFATPECAPFVKTGGLGDVSAALPAALHELDVEARVLLPGYPGVLAAFRGARELATVAQAASVPACRLLEASLPSGVPLIVADCPTLYARDGGPYQDAGGHDWPDNGHRFGALSRIAALLGSAASPMEWHADIVHCNDWQTGLAPACLHYTPPPRARSVMTVHNLAFHGSFDPRLVAELGLPPESYAMEGLEFHGRMSFLKAGLHYADALTTVSPTYAREIQTPEHGAGMDGLLRKRRADLTGIRNGIDTTYWNPATDALIESRYGPENLGAKRANKRALQRRLGLDEKPEAPFLGMVSRFTHQKGTDLVADVLPGLLGLPLQFAALGSGEREHEHALRSLADRHPGRISVTLGFDETLAHLIEAGADLFLMPSRFEPCGLNQMYSQRYGTPPVARATGGLADTIVDTTTQSLADGTATGFLFGEASAPALAAAIRRALDAWRDPVAWRALQRNGMARDFGWMEPARRYVEVYRRLVAAAGS
ncbi:MAG: glycogen synthase GlgA [Burkholderiales bacterium]|nr:glycogen synthase GlgA [Burkholderiales bacterium]